LACDFFSVKVCTWRGPVEYFVLFFLHVGSRRVRIAGITANPDGSWMAQQARNVSVLFGDEPVKPTHLLRDFDSKFTTQFDAILKQDGIAAKPVRPRAPNLNAFAERWVQSIRRECLDHFVLLGEDHLRHVVSEYVDWYNRVRPHQGRDNRPLTGESPPSLPPPTEVACDTRLGGLLRHYRRAG